MRPVTLYPLLLPLAYTVLCAAALAVESDALKKLREEEPFKTEREQMVTNQIATAARGADAVSKPEVLDAMRTTPRHAFVPENRKRFAYENSPLPIGHGQTISQPYIVAYMTEILGVDSEDSVLEIGTGSGYQAAVLAEIVKEVYTIEIVEPLHERATATLKELGYTNVHTRLGDGYNGWPDKAPFDAIIVTAAASHIPPPLIEQLKPGGRMAIPLGPPFAVQSLMLVTKRDDGTMKQEVHMAVRFVPLTGDKKAAKDK